jgi:fermentation-respiration switch protein FrsA (DUF1100 family)
VTAPRPALDRREAEVLGCWVGSASRNRVTHSTAPEAKVDTHNPDRGPLLIISGEKDHTVPLAFVKRFTQGEKEGGSHAY